MPITAKASCHIDDTGRTRIFHGVNLGGSSEIPTDPPVEADEHEGPCLYDEACFDYLEADFLKSKRCYP